MCVNDSLLQKQNVHIFLTIVCMIFYLMQKVVKRVEYFESIKMHPISPFVSLLSLPCAGDSPVSDTSFDSGASTTSQTPQIEKEILCLTHCA